MPPGTRLTRRERPPSRSGARASRFFRRLRRSEIAALSGDAFYVSVWQGSSAAAELVQIALITHVLGLESYGRFALVLACVAFVDGFVKVRVGYTAIAFGASALARDKREAAGLFQLTFLIDVLTGVAGFLIVIVLAPFVGSDLTGGAGTTLIILASLTLLAGGPEETCSSVLRLLDRFRLVAIYSTGMEVVRIGLVVGALVVYESLAAVLVAIVVAKLGRAVLGTVVTVRTFNRAAGGEARLTVPSLRHIRDDERRPMLRMMFHTNFISYCRAAQNQLPTLLLGSLAGLTETAIYKLGTAAAAGLAKVIDPASAALLPRLARYWAAGRVRDVRRLIRNASLISVPSMVLLLTVIVVFQEPILELLGGREAAKSAGPVLILAGVSGALYGAVFWHSTVLYTARQAGIISVTTLATTVLHIAVLLVLVPSYGAIGAAIALLGARIFGNVVLTTIALRTLSREELTASVA
jgi:O-antigen/teichoic acid export membrane protein